MSYIARMPGTFAKITELQSELEGTFKDWLAQPNYV